MRLNSSWGSSQPWPPWSLSCALPRRTAPTRRKAASWRDHPPDTRAQPRTDQQFDPLAVSDRGLWPFRARQRDSDRCSHDRSAFGLERDFSDIGIESPLPRLDAHLRRAAAQCPGPDRPVSARGARELGFRRTAASRAGLSHLGRNLSRPVTAKIYGRQRRSRSGHSSSIL
jgi:hypothetical protein